MGKYNFVRKELTEEEVRLLSVGAPLGVDRCSVTYAKPGLRDNGIFDKLEYFDGGKKSMILANTGGTLMVVDTRRDVSFNPINKIHIGSQYIETPHAESFEQKGVQGIRVDLAEFDTKYLTKMLDDLVSWRDMGYREMKRREYAQKNEIATDLREYSAPFRLAQLNISKRGLETKIRELKLRRDHLRSKRNRATRRLVSSNCGRIESASTRLIQIVDQEISSYESSRRTEHVNTRPAPKVIINQEIFPYILDIGRYMTDIFNHIHSKMSPKDIERAKHYWERVAAWGNL